MLLAYLFIRRVRRSKVEQAIHDRLQKLAKARRIPLRPFSFEALAELRARRAAGLADTWLMDVPTGHTMSEYLGWCRAVWERPRWR